MDPMIISAIIAGIVGIATAIGSNVTNWNANESTNEKNESLMRESWEREDTSLQRARIDAEKAGFSPLAGLGGLSAGQPIQLTPSSIDLSSASSSVQNSVNSIGKTLSDKQANEDAAKVRSLQLEGMEEDLFSKRLENKYKEQRIVNELAKMIQDYNIDDAKLADIIGNLVADGVISSSGSEDSPHLLGMLAQSAHKNALRASQKAKIDKDVEKIGADIKLIQQHVSESKAKVDFTKMRTKLTKIQAKIAKGDLDAGNLVLPDAKIYYYNPATKQIDVKNVSNITVQNYLSRASAYIEQMKSFILSGDAKQAGSDAGWTGFRSFTSGLDGILNLFK